MDSTSVLTLSTTLEEAGGSSIKGTEDNSVAESASSVPVSSATASNKAEEKAPASTRNPKPNATPATHSQRQVGAQKVTIITPEPGPHEQRLDSMNWIDPKVAGLGERSDDDNDRIHTATLKTPADWMQAMFTEKSQFTEASNQLFVLQQEFHKQVENIKKQKTLISNYRTDYIDKMTLYALRDSELRYQKEQLLYAEESWQEIMEEQQRLIGLKRQELENALLRYRYVRQRISNFQERLTAQTEERRMNTLNSIAFVHYAKTLLEQEIRKVPEKKLLPSKKSIQRTKLDYQRRMEIAKKELHSFYADKILEFRRHERILLGRTKDLTDLQISQMKGSLLGGGGLPNVGNSSSNTNAPNTAELLHDSLEHRIANKLLAMTEFGHLKDSFDQMSDDEDGKAGGPSPTNGAKLPPLSSTANSNTTNLNNTAPQHNYEAKTKASSAAAAEAEKARKLQHHQLNVQQVDHLLFDAPNSEKKRGMTPLSSQRARSRQGGSPRSSNDNSERFKEWTGYHPDEFWEACSGDYIRPHAILDTNRGIGEREEHLCNIAYLCSHAKGKLKQLTAIRDGLDVELSKQAALLMTIVNALEKSYGKNAPTASASRPATSHRTLNLPSSCRFVQMDFLQRDEEIHRLQERIFHMLQPHAPKIY